jgi:hypothetical protein
MLATRRRKQRAKKVELRTAKRAKKAGQQGGDSTPANAAPKTTG